MPRQSRSRPAASKAAPAPAQSRGAHTAAMPGGASAAPAPPVPVATGQPGLGSRIAEGAASVAAGSVIGNLVSNALFGGRHAEPAAEPAAEPLAQATPVAQQNTQGLSCEVQAKQFTQCLEKADLPSCTWYLEQLKACQAAAAPY